MDVCGFACAPLAHSASCAGISVSSQARNGRRSCPTISDSSVQLLRVPCGECLSKLPDSPVRIWITSSPATPAMPCLSSQTACISYIHR
jgi:hypothetical protein